MCTSLNGWKMVYLRIILIVYFTSFSFGFPSRPLNERRADFTWQAWLLVDENQSQNRHPVFNSDGTLRRRITPKSVFIAPTFSPETLPACADGYSSDTMGRCIKIIKLDEKAHYDFIIKNLEDKFGSLDYDDEEQDGMEETSQGPLQLNIPLTLERDESKDDYSGEETDIAIVVSPTKPIVDIEHLNFKKRDSLVEELEHVKGIMTNITQPETTTSQLQPETTTDFIENEIYSTTLQNVDTTTTNEDLNVDDVITKEDDNSPTTTEINYETTTVIGINRLEDSTEDSLTTLPVTESETTPVIYQILNEQKIVTQSPKPIVLQNDSPYESTTEQLRFELTTASPKPEIVTQNTVRFPDQERSDQKFGSSLVRFPDHDYSDNTQLPPSIGTRDVQHFVASSYNKPKASEIPITFPDSLPFADQTNRDINTPHSVPNKAIGWEFNRRNRDKNSSVFMLPPKWNPSSFQKPLVLRFSRKHAFMDNNEFKSPAYYRSIPPDDFAYLFKFKQKRIRR